MATIETSSRTNGATCTMLACGVIAGPLFVATATARILTRDGFDPAPAPHQPALRGRAWLDSNHDLCPRLACSASSLASRLPAFLPMQSLGSPVPCDLWCRLVMGSIFTVDPALGLPAGAPEGTLEHITTHAMIHAFLRRRCPSSTDRCLPGHRAPLCRRRTTPRRPCSLGLSRQCALPSAGRLGPASAFACLLLWRWGSPGLPRTRSSYAAADREPKHLPLLSEGPRISA
jgi:hypothetical protein